MLSDRCLSCPVCLSVTLVYCGQTVGRIKMKLGTQVGLGSDHIVLDGDPAPLTKGAQPHFSLYLLWPNGWMNQDATWYGVGLGAVSIVLHGIPPKGAQPPIFGPCLLWPNGSPTQLLLSTCCFSLVFTFLLLFERFYIYG